MAMLHPGSPWPSGVTPIPSPAVPPKAPDIAIAITRFFSKYRAASKPPDWKDGDPIPLLEEEHWVEWVKKGEQNGSTCIEAIRRLSGNPERNLPPRIEWHVIGPAYEAWRRGEEMPVQGTPLFAWAGISRELASELKKFNILTLEDLALFPDHRIVQVPIAGLRELRQRAKTTVEARTLSDTGAALAMRDEKIVQLESANRETLAKLAALEATIAAMGGAASAAAQALGASMPHPDDEFVQPGPGDVRVSSRRGRRQPVDHIEKALAGGEGFEADGDAA